LESLANFCPDAYGRSSAFWKLNLETGVVFDWRGLCFFEVFDNVTIVLVGSDWILNGARYTNPITIKGSNMYEAWATDKAI